MDKEHPPDWGGIVERHAERVYRIAYRILGSVHDAEDVSQTVFLEAYRMRKAGPVQSWPGLLARLATVRAIDCLRRRRRTVGISEEDCLAADNPHEQAVGAELAEWLRGVVARLPEQQAAVFSLMHFEQLERHAVAAILGMSPEAVSAALFKARQRLLEQFRYFNGAGR